MGVVFVNYRAKDHPLGAAGIHDMLARRFGGDRVFRDSVSMAAGDHYPTKLREGLEQADVLVAVIGPRWNDLTDEQGQLLIQRDRDWVRWEIVRAIEREIPIIPVLLRDTPEDATPPDRAILPASLHELAEYQMFEVSQKRFGLDLDRLADRLVELVPSLVRPRDQDLEADRHWGRLARGVMSNAEAGDRFQGRETALQEITSWLNHPECAPRVLVVTGSPGAGKSAVLGRIVITASHAHDGRADPDQICDDAPRELAGSVDCAVHAKGKTALEVAREIACAASAPIPDQPEYLPAVLQAALRAQQRQRFNLIIDALDEAADPAQIRAIALDVLLPIAKNRTDVGAQVAVGTRRFDGESNLLELFPGSIVIDLDERRYFELVDLTAYAQATLQLSGAERRNNPYQDDAIARPVAQRIAELAGNNFLIAGLVARTHGLYDTHAVPVDEIRFVSRVGHVLTEFLRQLAPVEGIPAVDLLTALAYVRGPGVPLGLWQTALSALTGKTITDYALWQFARASAANFLIETAQTTITGSVFRLFHQALNDALLHHVPPGGESALAMAFIACGRDLGWHKSPAYLLRSLPDHAARAGLIDDLLADPDYPLHVDLRRLITAAAHATSEAGARMVMLLHRTPDAFDASATQRLALFSVTEALDQLDTGYRQHPGPAPYRAVWASGTPRTERAILTGHTSGVNGVCAVRVDGRTLLASAAETVRIWDPVTGTEIRQLTGHTSWVRGACAVRVDGRDLLASAGDDATVRIWDPATGTEIRQLTGHTNWICAVRVGGQDLLAAASVNATVRIWDPATGTEIRQLDGHSSWVWRVRAVRVDGRDLLASASHDRTVRIWDPATGTEIRQLNGHTDAVWDVCAVRVDGRDLLASVGDDMTVRIWDPATGTEIRQLNGHTDTMRGVCAVRVNGQDLLALASVGFDAMVRIWDPSTGTEIRQLNGHTNGVTDLCAVQVDGQDLLASASSDATVRIWDPSAGTETHTVPRQTNGVNGVCAVRVDGRDLVASAGDDATVRIWDPATGTEIRQLDGHTHAVWDVCAVRVDGRQLLASASRDRMVRIWDPATGTEIRQLNGHTDTVFSVCVVQVHGRDLLVSSAGPDDAVRIWDPATGTEIRQLTGDAGGMNGVCAVRVQGRDVLASAGWDTTVRIWDPVTGTEMRQLIDYSDQEVHGVHAVRVEGRDLLAIKAGDDSTIRILNPATGTQIRQLTAHTGGMTEVCAVQVNGRDLLASAGWDRTVRIWDPVTGTEITQIPTYADVNTLIAVDAHLVIGLATGLLTLRLPRAASHAT